MTYISYVYFDSVTDSPSFKYPCNVVDTVSQSPSLSDTVIDNLISRKEIRADAIRRARARDRTDFIDFRQDFWNTAAEINNMAPASKFLIKQKLEPTDFPDHLAVIPDGNRRWARSRDLTVGEGYAMGSRKLEKAREWAMIDNDVDIITNFTLSTENIERRPEGELKQLFGVFTKFFNRTAESEEVHENEIKHGVRGNPKATEKLPQEVKDAINNMEQATENYNNKKVIFLMPYGGRDEIIKASRQSNTPLTQSNRIVVGDKAEDEDTFREHLLLGDLPDVDLMIRTSEVRLSNFMLYHNAYAEFVFLQKNWPSFTESDFYESVYKYSNRDRRFGV